MFQNYEDDFEDADEIDFQIVASLPRESSANAIATPAPRSAGFSSLLSPLPLATGDMSPTSSPSHGVPIIGSSIMPFRSAVHLPRAAAQLGRNIASAAGAAPLPKCTQRSQADRTQARLRALRAQVYLSAVSSCSFGCNARLCVSQAVLQKVHLSTEAFDLFEMGPLKPIEVFAQELNRLEKKNAAIQLSEDWLSIAVQARFTTTNVCVYTLVAH